MKRYLVSILMLVGIVGSVMGQQQAVTTSETALPLTDGSEYLMAPEWNPAGTLLAATSVKYQGIYLISYPEGEVQQISDLAGAGFGMQWSATGNEIVARISRYIDHRRESAIAAFSIPDGGQRLLSDYNRRLPGTPEWGPDGNYVYLNGTDQFKAFSTTQRQGAEPVTLSDPGAETIYVKRDRIYIHKPDTGEEIDITPVEGRVLNLTLSPSGDQMAFEIMGGHLWVCERNGENPRDLGVGNDPSWSPDGTKLTYIITEDDGHQITSSDIYVIRGDGTGKVNITNTADRMEMHPDWSPEGQWIAYNTLNSGQIFIQEVE